MKLVSSVVAVAVLSAILPAQAQDRVQKGSPPGAEAVGDPLRTIYRISGLRDNGGNVNTGVASSIHCTNFNSVSERVRFVIRDFNGAQLADLTFTLTSRQTFTASTHGTNVFTEDSTLGLVNEVINQGSATIQATSVHVHCSAMIVDAASASPLGIALHMVRVGPAPNTQE